MNFDMRIEFLEGKVVPSEQNRDDRSCLLLRQRQSDYTMEVTNKINNQENIYIQSNKRKEGGSN